MAINITVSQANRIVNNRSNGSLEGIDGGKGGRAWLEGEWQLDELEALCVLIRDKAGDNAQGAEDIIKYWEDNEI